MSIEVSIEREGNRFSLWIADGFEDLGEYDITELFDKEVADAVLSLNEGESLKLAIIRIRAEVGNRFFAKFPPG